MAVHYRAAAPVCGDLVTRGKALKRAGQSCISTLPLILATAWIPAQATNGIDLTVVHGPGSGEAALSWTGSLSPYEVYRSTDPSAVVAPGNLLGGTSGVTWNDPGIPPAIFYYQIFSVGCASRPDPPDLSFTDSNCDGIDGDAAEAIFVDIVSGDDSNPGTMADPMMTISTAILEAEVAEKDVYVSLGTYVGPVALANGVSLYGGYDATSGWSRSIGNVTSIVSPSPSGLEGVGLTQPTEVQLFTISAATAPGAFPNGDGRTSFGVLIRASSGPITLRGLDVTAGDGSAGLNGVAGTQGSGGGAGGSASGPNAGARGASSCGALGGLGGAGPSGAAPGMPGGAGAPGGGSGGVGGQGGASGTCSSGSSSNGGPAPLNAVPGGAGPAGSPGSPGLALGILDSSGVYIPPAGGDGLPGLPGGGGGGGGSGGGTAHGHDFFGTNCVGHFGGGGGGGGGGGCGGSGGAGGRGGGGSFAIAVSLSNVVVDQSILTSGRGGTGGGGGGGGTGGTGGGPGPGVAGQIHTNNCSTRSGGAGAGGAPGGSGGVGGGASGGTGGASICVIYKGSAPTVTSSACTNGTPGSGGPGGFGSQPAPPGANGLTGTVVSSN